MLSAAQIIPFPPFKDGKTTVLVVKTTALVAKTTVLVVCYDFVS